MKKIFILFKDSITGWLQNDAVLHSAALAYFTIFSLAPLLIISVAIAGMLFNTVMGSRDAEMKAIKDDVKRNEQSIDNIDSKLDKIYEILIEMNRSRK